MQTDSIIVLAWPQTHAKAIGRWYDKVTKLFGYLNDGYYKAGHAAAVLVNSKTKETEYFDFGRYHMPREFGRVRNKITDPGLILKTEVKFSEDYKIENIQELLFELKSNKTCHGDGPLYASVLTNINFNSAYNFAIKLQNKDAVKYGPYELKGTNCSRFIASLIKSSTKNRKVKARLSTSILLTPLTKANVFACNNHYYKIDDEKLTINRLTYRDQIVNFMLPFKIEKSPKEFKDKSQKIHPIRKKYDNVKLNVKQA